MDCGKPLDIGAPSTEESNPQLFCLRWNNYQSNLTNVFDQLLQNENFVDVTLACGDGHTVKAHKMVLSACSPYFQSLFFENPCKHPIVILKDISWTELKAAVEFMYKGEINVCQEQIGPLLKVAESLKIRGLADVNSEHDLKETPDTKEKSPCRPKKRRRSTDRSSTESAASPAPERVVTPVQPRAQTPRGPTPLSQMPPPSVLDDLEIKPGIAEMIREEERAKMLETSQAWLSASTSPLTSETYQYQLQSMWQKCWSTNQSLVHNLRFRERGPLKSWRPETMAEAILSVLKEGLSLSQAARKYDIPYPTFVLYANRVHNMLGPSADGGSDLRPKGRGRPQRILLGFWPEEHIQNVIRTVVFRDPQHIKDEPLNLGYPRISCFQDQLGMYGNNSSCINSPEPPVSPNSTAAAVAVIAQGFRNQMLAAAAAQSTADSFGGYFSPQCHNGTPTSLAMGTPLHSPNSTPPTSPGTNNHLESLGMQGSYKPSEPYPVVKSELIFQDDIEDLVMKSPHSRPSTASNDQHKPLPLVLEQRD